MKLSLLNEWIQVDGRDETLSNALTKQCFRLLSPKPPPDAECTEILDELEKLVLAIIIDKDGKEQFQKDLISEILEHIKQARNLKLDRAMSHRLGGQIQDLLYSLLRDKRGY